MGSVDYKTSKCSLCEGTHYGSHDCPFRCERCTVNTGLCLQEGCPRDARFAKENAEADARIASRKGKRCPTCGALDSRG